MTFQLVLQFQSETLDDYDALISLEEELIVALAPRFKVDGHDCGAGEFNIFILTEQPRAAFTSAHMLVQQASLKHSFKAAYRDLSQDSYIILWPPQLTTFTLA